MKSVAQNRRARYDFDIVDTVEAGIQLTGQEAKSCRMGHVNLAGSYVSFHGGKTVLKNASIAVYPFASGVDDYQPGRDRVLLLKKDEVRKIESAVSEKGVTAVPLEVRAGKFIKLLIGLGKGRKRIDKRERIKERDVERRIKQGKEI